MFEKQKNKNMFLNIKLVNNELLQPERSNLAQHHVQNGNRDRICKMLTVAKINQH